MSVPPDQMMAPPGPPGPPGMGGPPLGTSMLPPNLLPFATTQPQGVTALAAPLLQQQQMDLEAFKQQQLETLMGVVMQSLQQMPNPAAEAAQTEPSAPMDGTGPMGDAGLAPGGPPDPNGFPGGM